MPNLGTGRGEGGARARAAGGGRGSRAPRRRGGARVGETRGFRGTLTPKSLPLLPKASLPEALSPCAHVGVPVPLGEGCGAPAQPRGVCAGPRRSPAAPRPRTTRRSVRPTCRESRRRRPRPPARGGTSRWGCSPEPGSARGTGAASPERAFSNALATAGWGERARRELQQVSLAQPSVPCPRTAVICAPHRSLLGSSPASRPAHS